MEKSARIAYKKKGFKGLFQYSFQRIIGMQQYDERINTMYYFLNSYCDIHSFPKAQGPIRKVQEGDALLLSIVDTVCKKNGLNYWIDAGTCLGAVRHDGFIPWDDDVDISMPRDDYEKACAILKNELEQYGIDVEERKNEATSRIGIGFRHHETGLWVDVFPAEYTTIDPHNESDLLDYYYRAIRYKKKWRKKKEKLERNQAFSFRKKNIPEICEKENAKSIALCLEFATKPVLSEVDCLLPPKPIIFEGYQVMGPNNPHSYLTNVFGDYMKFPQTGLEHHGDDRGNLSTWANNSGIDMDEIIQELRDILKRIEL